MKSKGYERVLLLIAIVVTILWVIATIVQTIWPNHKAPESVNHIMLIVATFFFAGSVAKNALTKNDSKSG